MSFCKLKSLSLRSYGWEVRVRLVRKSPVYSFTNSRTGQPGTRCKFVFMDDERTHIDAVAFDHWCSVWHPVLEVGIVYGLSGCGVKNSYEGSSGTGSDPGIELSFSKFTKLRNFGDVADFPRETIVYTKLSDAVALRDIQTLSVVGWVTQVGPLEEINSQTKGNLKKREVEVIDDTLPCDPVTVVVWGDVAESFAENYRGPVKVVRGYSSFYGGGLSISTSADSVISTNSGDTDFQEINQWKSGYSSKPVVRDG